MAVKFVHAADLHLDSPMKGLERYDGAPVKLLQGATRRAFERVIDVCLEEEVDFLLLAGDLFDGDWKDMNTGLFAIKQLARLGDIPVCLVRGNHDATSQITRRLSWPSNVKEFDSSAPETLILPTVPVAIHGQSFARRDVKENLAVHFPQAIPDHLNIGLLHTSLTGSPDHYTYAPAKVDELLSKKYDYWALGHIHQRREVRTHPFIIFPGNTQGRSLREAGAKGCMLVTALSKEITDMTFVPTDVARWYQSKITLGEAHDFEGLYREAQQAFHECKEDAGNRLAAVRMVITGSTPLHRRLQRRLEREEVVAEIQSRANDLDDEIWVESVQFQTRPPVDVEKLRKGKDLIGDLLRLVTEIRSDPDDQEELFACLSSLSDRAATELAASEIDLQDPDQAKIWLAEAENLLASLLTEADS